MPGKILDLIDYDQISSPVSHEGGRIVRIEVDYSSVCDVKIPMCKELAKNEAKFNEALDQLSYLEKQSRLGSDVSSSSRILVAIVQIIYEARKMNLLNDYIGILVKKRSQSKQAITKMIQEVASYVNHVDDKETKVKLLETLLKVTEGKIYVENDRARLSKILADIKEKDGDLLEAAKIMEALQVETYGSMDKREKVEFILEQMRLCLAKHDVERTQIISKKINVKFFSDPEQQDLKLKYYNLMILVDKDKSFLSTARHHMAIANLDEIKNDQEKRQEILMNAVIYCILAPHDNEQVDMLNNLLKNKDIEEVPGHRSLIKLFLCKELINFNALCKIYGHVLWGSKMFAKDTEIGDKSWDEMKKRLIEHNLRMLAKYYTQIKLDRMAQLLELDEQRAEEYVAKLVNEGLLKIKFDRPAGVISFVKTKNQAELLNAWAEEVNTLMTGVNRASHLIHKENCLNKLKLIRSAF